MEEQVKKEKKEKKEKITPKRGALTEEEMYNLEKSINEEMANFEIAASVKKQNSWAKARLHKVG